MSLPRLLFLFLWCLAFALLCSACASRSLPGRYLGHWRDVDGTEISAELVLTPDGRALMNLQRHTSSGTVETTSWEARYRLEKDKIILGSEEKTYGVFLRKGNVILDPSHSSEGKPLRLEKQEGY